MSFSMKSPLLSDPEHQDQEDYTWGKSNEKGAYYAWVQYTSAAVQLTGKPTLVDLPYGLELAMYKGPMRQEMLYRIRFTKEQPLRLVQKPHHCLFFTFGNEGGVSKSVKYWYRDKFLTLLEWTDKKAFVAVLRQQNYLKDEHRFWSRQQS